MKVAVILNKAAGSSNGDAEPDRIRELFAALDCEASVSAIEEKALEDAVKSGVDALVAAGGDGTVSFVARASATSGIPLGVLPVGTLNHFAKDAGIPLDLEEAVRNVIGGEPTAIDMGEVNGVLFLNNSSVGIYPSLVQARNAWQDLTGHGKWSAMFRAGLRVFRRFPVLHVRMEVDGVPFHRRTPVVFIGNNEYQMNLFKQGSRSCLTNGCLSLFITNCEERWCMARLFARFLVGRLDQAKDFESKSVAEVWIEHRKRSLHVSVDGEVIRLEPPLHYTVRPLALRVILPRAAVM
ncbi:MAG: diacylglycerol kinase family protein [FCB group bacterium]|jgi:diacylglycerol kinase family enzyme|nr:diacylglycerol kinase family protein [FCB group bacterium]